MERLLSLADCFAVDVYSYAVMSNHFHTVIHIDPDRAWDWPAEEVARRWVTTFAKVDMQADARSRAINSIVQDPARVAELRRRLGNISWLMRCLKEPIARRANREDDCTGRFWEGRFTSQLALDLASILSTMVYVDLNPVRAGISLLPEEGPFTSMPARVRRDPHRPLSAIAGSLGGIGFDHTESEYLALVDWTGRRLHPDKVGFIGTAVPPIMERLGVLDSAWTAQVSGTETCYCGAIGSARSLTEKARQAGKKWLKGIAFARAAERGAGMGPLQQN